MIFAYYLMLSDHMWDDENTPPRFLNCSQAYSEKIDLDEKTWDETIDYLAETKYNMVVIDIGDGVVLDSHPEIAASNAWSKEKLMQKLDVIRQKGMTPIPKLNFSTCHHTWLKMYRHMIGTPKYYEVVADIIKEVSEIFGKPSLFHLGMDEETLPMQKYREIVVIRGEKLWWHDAYYLFEQVEKNGARPWVWSDYFWEHPDLFAKNMPKEVLQSNWFYREFLYYDNSTPTNIKRANYMHTYDKLNALGYEQVPTCSTWAAQKNPYQTLLYCKNIIDPALLKGYMTASWAHTSSEEILTLKNDAFRLFKGREKVYPETL